jgi:hypothetical protein
MPFVETGEFANVGIVLMCQEAGYFDFQLLNRVRRITAFFDQLEPRIYRESRNDLATELRRIKTMMEPLHYRNDKSARFLFQELIRPREVMLRFDAPRVVLTDNPEKKLEELFNFYIERDFVTPEYLEKQLEKNVRLLLNEAHLKNSYKEGHVQHGAFNARFPFAHHDEDGRILKAIKPLHLAHVNPAHAYEHGWAWVGKIRQLKKFNVLPDQILIAAQAPAEGDTESFTVFQEVQNDFKDLDIELVPLSDTQRIKEFARLH